jgi:hypothetical protein
MLAYRVLVVSVGRKIAYPPRVSSQKRQQPWLGGIRTGKPLGKRRIKYALNDMIMLQARMEDEMERLETQGLPGFCSFPGDVTSSRVLQ